MLIVDDSDVIRPRKGRTGYLRIRNRVPLRQAQRDADRLANLDAGHPSLERDGRGEREAAATNRLARPGPSRTEASQGTTARTTVTPRRQQREDVPDEL